uniref:Uncharacterized protein n=1 Tax=Caenorhabditis japonica TaxID=281687 RepID=A0A8R1EHE4_CAEJA
MEDVDDVLEQEEFGYSNEVEETTTEAPVADPFGETISTISCKDGFLSTLEDLLNYVAAGWKYHVSNTDGVKQAWFKLDNATSRICQHIGGLKNSRAEQQFVFV